MYMRQELEPNYVFEVGTITREEHEIGLSHGHQHDYK